MGLQEKLTRLKKEVESQAPKEIVEIMHRATVDLGIIRHAAINADYTIRPDPQETVAALKKIVG